MNYSEIFSEVVSIMENDSSTCNDMGAGNYQKYKRQIREDMPEAEFTRLVKLYLASFGLEGHLSFNDTNMGKIDFEVMRYENALYVTNAASTSALKHGDKIVGIDGQTIECCASQNEEFLMGETDERQGFLWDAILLFADNVSIERDGKRQEVALTKTTVGYSPENLYSYRDLGNKTLLIRLLDFSDEEAIRNLYEECKPQLSSCENLIIDVRNNGGGSDTAFFPLFEYCYPEGKSVDEFLPKSQPPATNYSLRNCDVRLKMIDDFFAQGIPDDIRPMVEKMKNQLAQNRGKGLIAEESGDDDGGLGIFGRALPKKVWILTDQGCASSGEAFVEDMSYSPKVTVVGRPTLGILDYSNCSVVMLDHFRVLYPTSRRGDLDVGKRMGHKGVPVDHYIPWSPLHLEKDVELEYVLEQIELE
ncbi:MAG: hypothetical protein IJQ33_10540 [Clostridia bacterium]|nr:hypothetical protein [Clostridia bacterium]